VLGEKIIHLRVDMKSDRTVGVSVHLFSLHALKSSVYELLKKITDKSIATTA